MSSDAAALSLENAKNLKRLMRVVRKVGFEGT
jgi:hypothetical protein